MCCSTLTMQCILTTLYLEGRQCCLTLTPQNGIFPKGYLYSMFRMKYWNQEIIPLHNSKTQCWRIQNLVHISGCFFSFKIPCRWHAYSNIIFKTIRVQLQGNEEYVNNSSKSTFSLNNILLLSPLVMPLTSRAHTCTFMGEYFNTCRWLRYLDRG